VKDKNFWIQTIVQTLAPLVLGSGLIFVLTQFKERLPEWSYNVIISAIYIVFIVVLIVLVVALVRLLFSDWFTDLQRERNLKKTHRERITISTDWQSRWSDLANLLTDTNEREWKISKEQKDQYSNLRLWFIKSRSEFLPIWHSFRQNRRSTASEREVSTSSLVHKVYYENHDDPFSYFYTPLPPEKFSEILRYYQRDVPEVLTQLREDLDEFIEWVRIN
jgi:hypothetical protein